MSEPQLIAVDRNALAAVHAELRALRQMLTNAQITPRDEWLTVAEAAKEIGVSTDTINRRIRNGEMRANGQTGKMRRVKLND
ncbi:MAG: DNA-binding protein [Rhodovulum sp.]|nr:DNA-binding protein [Rhodovulum sp.]|tara:strand:+ start:510 stop:755 length:246 start_codon:yes stop_codon:yes gene_type:complete